MERSLITIRRTGRVLAMSRAIFAMVFLLALLLEPDEPARLILAGHALLVAYLGWALLLAAIAHRSWWWDFHLSWVVHAVDIVVFLTAATLTETGNNDFSSPYTAFAAFVLMAALLRWGRPGVAVTAVSLLVCYAMVLLALRLAGAEIDIHQFARRQTYTIALSMMFLWLAVDDRTARIAPPLEPAGTPGERRDAVVRQTLAHARAVFHARGAAIAVARSEEPWIDVWRDIDGRIGHERLGPDAMIEDFGCAAGAALFDQPRGRRIMGMISPRVTPVRGAFRYALAQMCGAAEGLLGGFATPGNRGQLLVWDMRDPAIDDIPVADQLARETGLSLDREDMVLLARAHAVSGVQQAIARDLHDSVAQLLAGAQFRLEALRRAAREGDDPDGEIVALKDALRTEQAHLRAMIDRLRQGVQGGRGTDLGAEMAALLTDIGVHWQIDVHLDCRERPLTVSIVLAHELRLLIREAAANAARHGRCDRLDVAIVATGHGTLHMTIEDNGRGFPERDGFTYPRSISERVAALGGRLNVINNGTGARLEIELPHRDAA